MAGFTQKPTLLTYISGMMILLAAALLRFYYFSEFQPVDAPSLQAWQVQGSTISRSSPDATELDDLVASIKQFGYFDGFRAYVPLGPETVEPTAYRSPLFPMFRAAVELGSEQIKDLVDISSSAALRWVNLLLGSLTCLLYYLIALRGFGNHHFLAWLVGLATAAYPIWIINTGELEDGVLVTFLLAWSLCLGMGLGQKGGVLRSLLFGIVLAALVLTRASLLPLAIAFQLWFFVRCRYIKQGWLCGILTLTGFAAALTPWLTHCYQQFKAPVPIVTTAWLHVWIGNNEYSNGDAYQWRMKNKLSKELLKKLESTEESQRYYLLAETVQQEVINRPIETLKRRVRSALQFLLGSNNFSGSASFWPGNKTMAPPEWLRPVMLISMLAMYALFIFGWRWSYGWKFASAPLSLVIYWLPIPYLLSHSGQWHSSRIPMDGALMVISLLGLVGCLPYFNRTILHGEQSGGDPSK